MKNKLKILLFGTIIPALTGCTAVSTATNDFNKGYGAFVGMYNEGIKQYKTFKGGPEFVGEMNSFFNALYGWIMIVWMMVLGIAVIALILSILRYGQSGEIAPKRQKAQDDIMTSLIVIACTGGAPMIVNILMSLLGAFGVF